MASVQHLYCDANWISSHIIKENQRLEPQREKVHYAALTIQRQTRAYMAWMALQRLHNAATVLQKYIRRFLVKINMPTYMLNYLERTAMNFYNKMATKIQSLWRGYWSRKNNLELNYLREQKRMAKQNAEFLERMKALRKQRERELMAEAENEARRMVLFILFKLHHLLRTQRPGILSNLDTTDPSWVEQLLKSLKFSAYMRQLKKVFNTHYAEPAERPCILKGRLRNCERAYYKRNKELDPKPKSCLDSNIYEQEKPFCFDTRITKKYEPYAMTKEEYKPAITAVLRDLNSAFNLSEHDFDITMRWADFKQKYPDYDLNFWTRICDIHNIPQHLL